MKVLIATGAVFALAACAAEPKPVAESAASVSSSASSSVSSSVSSSAASSPSSSPSSSLTEAAPTVPAAPATGSTPNRDFVIGKWGTDGDCAMAIDLRADGTSDGPFGDWTYSDGVIGFADAPDFRVSVTVIDDNTMESTNDSGKITRMTRCP